MSQADRWLLPDGIEELLPPQAIALETQRRTLLDQFHQWGYELIMPPQVEYLESLLTGTGHDLELQTFKVTDQLTGRMMGVSADITPQVARIDAHSWPVKGASRLCYCGTVLHTRASSLLSSRSPLQIGAELYGEAGSNADFEIISLMLESVQAVGLQQVYLDLGHVGVYRALVAAVGLNAEQQRQFSEALLGKDVTAYAALVAAHISAEYQAAFAALISLNGDTNVLGKAQDLLRQVPDALSALSSLQELCARIAARYPTINIYVDLAELRGYDYHTGVVFAAYVAGHGQAIAKGGRYDQTGSVFGRARPATGFSADLKQWVALTGVATLTDDAIFAPLDPSENLWQAVQKLRGQGKRVISALSSSDSAQASGCSAQLVNANGQWVVESLLLKGSA
jgi:ATP phosphoribosyltransferase regulatory subunit